MDEFFKGTLMISFFGHNTEKLLSSSSYVVFFKETTHRHPINCCDQSFLLSAPPLRPSTHIHTAASASVFDPARGALLSSVLGGHKPITLA